MRRIGILLLRAEDDPVGQAQVAAFVQTSKSLGWTAGRNVQIDIRWGVADAASSRRCGGNGRACARHHSD